MKDVMLDEKLKQNYNEYTIVASQRQSGCNYELSIKHITL